MRIIVWTRRLRTLAAVSVVVALVVVALLAALGFASVAPAMVAAVALLVVDIAVRIRDFRVQQSIGLRTNLMRGPVIHPQRARSSANVDAELLPREGLLEDALAEIAGEEEAVGTATAEGGQKAQLGDADVLRLVDDDVVERRPAERRHPSRQLVEHLRLGDHPVGVERAARLLEDRPKHLALRLR